MVKRTRDGDLYEEQNPSKRARCLVTDRISRLSDELILRVLSHLSVSELVTCQRLSSKYNTLAGDGQLWKARYYDRFVRPRASRLPGLKESGISDEGLYFASKASRWLEEDHLIKGGGRTNWKRQYRLRHNWSKGSCAVSEIQVAEQAPIPPVLVQMHEGVIYIADNVDGLRAWSAKGERRMIAQTQLVGDNKSPPMSIAIGSYPEGRGNSHVFLGFEDGSFSIYSMDVAQNSFKHRYSHESLSSGGISTGALSWPFVITMTATQRLSLYRFTESESSALESNLLKRPTLLHSLRSQTVWPPLSTYLRKSEGNLVISIAYTMPTYLSGWTVGIQELWYDHSGGLQRSRIASAIEQHYRPLAFASRPMMHHLAAPPGVSLATSTTMEFRHVHARPTSLSYTHPYLLVSHPDNTLMLYLVTSAADSLSIGTGTRLWGHTSSVSGAHVGRRGKAVSVSRRGDELRVWELEGGFASSAAKRRLAASDLSVRLKPGNQDATVQAGLDLVHNSSAHSRGLVHDDDTELTLTRGWIGFDEENVVVLKEQGHGRQALVVYDFT